MRLPSATCWRNASCRASSSAPCTACSGSGLSLSWGLLRLINLAHFGFAFLAAYLCYQMATVGMRPAADAGVIVPLFFAIGAGLHWVMARFAITPFNSLLVTFGLTGIIEALIQSIWTADFRKLESALRRA